MSEYVSKEELKEFFESIEITVAGRSRAEAISEVLQAICNGAMELPTTDAEPVRHGKWIGYAGTIGNECSVCGFITTSTVLIFAAMNVHIATKTMLHRLKDAQDARWSG